MAWVGRGPETDESGISSHPANVLMVRIGKIIQRGLRLLKDSD